MPNKQRTVRLRTPRTVQVIQTVVSKPKKRRRKNRKPKDARAKVMRANKGSYAQLILDPCNALVTYGPSAGSSANGYLLRTNKRLILHGTALTNNGILYWFPDFHTSGNNAAGGNLFYFETATPGTSPLNTNLVPFGSGAATTASTSNDPAYPFVNGSNCNEARTIASCLRVFNAAPISNVAGQMCVIRGITMAEMLNGGSSGPMSVNEAFTLAQRVERFSLETTEVKLAPSTTSSVFRAADVANSGIYTALGTTYPDMSTNGVNMGVVGTSASTVNAAANQASGVAIAWTGLSTSNANDLVFEFVKIIEWIPDVSMGLSETSPPVRPRTTYEDIVDTLNTIAPDWQESMMASAKNLISGAAVAAIQNAFTGSNLNTNNRMNRYLRNVVG